MKNKSYAENSLHLLFSIFIFLIYSFSFAQKQDTVRFNYKFNGNSLPVSVIDFKIDSKIKVPLLLFLHGAGERGVDNKMQLLGGIPDIIKVLKNDIKSSCIVVAPQCPKDLKWVDTDWTKASHKMNSEMTWPLAATVKLIDSILMNNDKIDQERVYVAGLSMGGFGTWELLQRFPEKFTAAIPVCGGGDKDLAENIKKIPVWAFHGKKDKVVLVNRTTDMVEKMKKVNKNVKVTIYPTDGHYIWKKAFGNREVINWLFSKRKNH
ncbi:MAG: prolyl oligopeptidase family serine peptidase [Bacteroidota bacterium]|jgi:predicted peptidase